MSSAPTRRSRRTRGERPEIVPPKSDEEPEVDEEGDYVDPKTGNVIALGAIRGKRRKRTTAEQGGSQKHKNAAPTPRSRRGTRRRTRGTATEEEREKSGTDSSQNPSDSGGSSEDENNAEDMEDGEGHASTGGEDNVGTGSSTAKTNQFQSEVDSVDLNEESVKKKAKSPTPEPIVSKRRGRTPRAMREEKGDVISNDSPSGDVEYADASTRKRREAPSKRKLPLPPRKTRSAAVVTQKKSTTDEGTLDELASQGSQSRISGDKSPSSEDERSLPKREPQSQVDIVENSQDERDADSAVEKEHISPRKPDAKANRSNHMSGPASKAESLGDAMAIEKSQLPDTIGNRSSALETSITPAPSKGHVDGSKGRTLPGVEFTIENQDEAVRIGSGGIAKSSPEDGIKDDVESASLLPHSDDSQKQSNSLADVSTKKLPLDQVGGTQLDSDTETRNKSQNGSKRKVAPPDALATNEATEESPPTKKSRLQDDVVGALPIVNRISDSVELKKHLQPTSPNGTLVDDFPRAAPSDPSVQRMDSADPAALVGSEILKRDAASNGVQGLEVSKELTPVSFGWKQAAQSTSDARTKPEGDRFTDQKPCTVEEIAAKSNASERSLFQSDNVALALEAPSAVAEEGNKKRQSEIGNFDSSFGPQSKQSKIDSQIVHKSSQDALARQIAPTTPIPASETTSPLKPSFDSTSLHSNQKSSLLSNEPFTEGALLQTAVASTMNSRAIDSETPTEESNRSTVNSGGSEASRNELGKQEKDSAANEEMRNEVQIGGILVAVEAKVGGHAGTRDKENIEITRQVVNPVLSSTAEQSKRISGGKGTEGGTAVFEQTGDREDASAPLPEVTRRVLWKKMALIRQGASKDSIQPFGFDAAKLHRVKILLFSEGSHVHRTDAFERIFSRYWDAICLRLSDRLSSHVSASCDQAIATFLVSKKLRKIHNQLIMGIMRKATRTFVRSTEIVDHIPMNWRYRVRMQAVKSTSTQQMLIKHKGIRSLERAFWGLYDAPHQQEGQPYRGQWQMESETQEVDSLGPEHSAFSGNLSPCIPGALAIEPTLRQAAEEKGLQHTDSATWLLTIALREHTKNILRGSIAHNKGIEKGVIPREIVRYPNILASNPKKDAKPGTESTPESLEGGCIRRVQAFDVYSAARRLPAGQTSTIGGAISRLSLENAFLSSLQSMSPSFVDHKFKQVHEFLASEIYDISCNLKSTGSERLMNSVHQRTRISTTAEDSMPDDATRSPLPISVAASSVHAGNAGTQFQSDSRKSSKSLSRAGTEEKSVEHEASFQARGPKDTEHDTSQESTDSPVQKDSDQVCQKPIAGVGRGAKNLAAMMARTGDPKKEADESPAGGSSRTCEGDRTSSIVDSEKERKVDEEQENVGSTDRGKEFVGKTDEAVEKMEGEDRVNASSSLLSHAQPEQRKEDLSPNGAEMDGGASNRGKGFGTKNLAAMRARSQTDVGSDKFEGKYDDT